MSSVSEHHAGGHKEAKDPILQARSWELGGSSALTVGDKVGCGVCVGV